MRIFGFFRSMQDAELDRAISEVRGDRPDAKSLSTSAERVWQRMQVQDVGEGDSQSLQVIRGCADIRSLLPAFYRGELRPARASIVEDHLRECVSCSSYAHGRELEAEAAAKWGTETKPPGTWAFARPFFAATAAAALVGLLWVGTSWYFAGPAGPRARVTSADGSLFAVSANNLRVLKPGDEVGGAEFIRTAAGSHATVKLYEGSDVEMNQRAEFAVSATRRDTSIDLHQGSIIVHAAKRQHGHLYVSAPDCRVAVTGTMFAVNSGTKGSRVTVIEGEVHVTHSGQENILHSGDQLATTEAIAVVPVPQEIAWSHDLDHELALLGEFSKLREKFEQIPTPPARYESKILPLLPQNTILYVSIPNLGEALEQANQIFQQQLSQSPVLQEWWSNVDRSSSQQNTLGQLVEQVRALSQYLGDEVVITMSGGAKDGPVLLAEIRQPGLQDFLQNHFASSFTNQQGASNLLIVNPQSLGSLGDNTHGMIMLVRQNLLIVGGHANSVRQMNAQIDNGTKGFVGTDFAQRIRNVYSGGAETLLAVNLAAVLNNPENHSRAFQTSGFNNVKYLVATCSDTPNHGDNRLMLEFSGPRSGIPSWLAEPAPMGSLDYVSANAGAAVSVVAKQPALMLDDVVGLTGSSDPNFSHNLAEMNGKLGFDLRNDLASALGGELTLALDGPLLPTPSWKMIVEVNHPGALQLVIEKLVERGNQEAQRSNMPGMTLDQQQIAGRTFYTIHRQGPGLATECDYVFADGYLLLAPSRALLLSALETHTGGTSLARSASFRSLLPSDNQANFSGMLYQNLSPMLKPIGSQISSQQLAILQQLAADAKPTVICAYGQSDRIEVATNGKLLDLNPGMMTLLHLVGHADHETSLGRNP